MIYELSKEHLPIAIAEVRRLTGAKEVALYENILVTNGECDHNRLAFTNKVFEEIFVSNTIEDVEWENYYKDNFCVRSNITKKEKALAKAIWNKLKDPEVKLVNAATEFHFFFIEDKIICGKLIHTRKEKFHLRRPDLRPGFFPVSLKPKLARALVNLSGVQEGKIWDPFCGTGGILLEAGLMGLDVEGSDLDRAMVTAAKKNFTEYKIKGKFSIADARKKEVECDAIVTDPPYGRRASLKKVKIETLYKEFLSHIYQFVNTVVIMAPNTIKVESRYRIMFETEEYVHASLTRKLLILEKEK